MTIFIKFEKKWHYLWAPLIHTYDLIHQASFVKPREQCFYKIFITRVSLPTSTTKRQFQIYFENHRSNIIFMYIRVCDRRVVIKKIILYIVIYFLAKPCLRQLCERVNTQSKSYWQTNKICLYKSCLYLYKYLYKQNLFI